MGQSPSSVRSRGSRQRSFRGFMRRNKLNSSSLSHTFSLPPSEEYPELMNINLATEEQLMTLPGVNRQLANTIVRHRQMIGRFKRVDDLALVSGIGAEKLELLRPEICTNSRKALSRASSCTQSLDSVRTNIESRLCSVNSASVFQLQCVPGLNQEIAANIVEYRSKKGPFKSLDDLIKVRGMDIVRLSTVKTHLSVESRKCESVQQLTNGYLNGCHNTSNLHSLNGSITNGVSSTPKINNTSNHRKSSSMPTRLPISLPNGFATAPVNDILDLLAAYSHRPIIEEHFNYERDGSKCCRIASWNINQLSLDKINNPGVREVVCRTILENKLSLIAVQDVLEESALRLVCEELNSPALRRVREWSYNSNRWEYVLPDTRNRNALGFLYESCGKANIVIEDIDLNQLLMVAETSDDRRRLVEELSVVEKSECLWRIVSQVFLINGRPLVLVNVHCDDQLSTEQSDWLKRVRRLAHASAIPLVVLGEFFSKDNLQVLGETYHPVIEEDVQTAIDPNTPGQSSIFTDNKAHFNGTYNVIKSGLSHLAIPRGWSWGGPASPFYPIYGEFLVPD